MKRFFPFLSASAAAAMFVSATALVSAQTSLTWEQVKARFEAANPALKADALGVDEMKAAEITAFLRPNPGIGLSSDGLQIAPHTLPGQGTHWLPLTGDQLVPSINYLHEREYKRELRLQSAKEGTQIAGSQHEDFERNLLFDLRSQFIQTLEAKSTLEVAKADLAFLALFGVSVETGVIMIEFINQLRSRRKGMEVSNEEHIVEAAVEGSVLRLRPVMMTMLVATLGLLPAALSHAIGSDSQRPFAIVIVGGLLANLVIGVFLLPTLYVWMAREDDVLPAAESTEEF